MERNAAYQKEYETAERNIIQAKRDAKAAGSYYVEAQHKLVFVVRIKGINKIPPKPRKVLQLLRLTRINSGTFVKVTKATLELLKLIEPYVAYGYPSYSTIRQLVYKRGFGKINKQRVPLSDNAIIEANLGKYGILSIDDLIHEIITVGPHFKQANNFCGHSSCPTHLVVGVSQESSSTLSKVVLSVTVKNSSTNWLSP